MMRIQLNKIHFISHISNKNVKKEQIFGYGKFRLYIILKSCLWFIEMFYDCFDFRIPTNLTSVWLNKHQIKFNTFQLTIVFFAFSFRWLQEYG